MIKNEIFHRHRRWWLFIARMAHLISIPLMVYTNSCMAQIKGLVTEEVTAQPLAGANIWLFNFKGQRKASTVTNTSGEFQVHIPRFGRCQIVVLCDGYLLATKFIHVWPTRKKRRQHFILSKPIDNIKLP